MSQDFGENTYNKIEDKVCIIISHKTLEGILTAKTIFKTLVGILQAKIAG